MSELDLKALEANFELWRKDRAPLLDISKAFERYSIEQILKDADLSDDDIDSGNFGNPDDGGVDGMYFFVNRTLMLEDTDIPDPALTADLYIIQATTEKSFKEERIDKLERFTRDLLDFARPVDNLTYLNSLARECISRFRSKYEAILGVPHTLTVNFCYAAKSDLAPNPKVTKKVDNIIQFVNQQISAAKPTVEFWGCQRLLSAARTSSKKHFTLEMSEKFATDDKRAVVCLVNLKDLAKFLTDDRGGIRQAILDPNVRAYQGRRNPVNTDIRVTLGVTDEREFWWLNNGITVLCENHSFTGNTLTVVKPEIVNGLQTSQEIYEYFRENPTKAETRNVLIRVIVPPDEQTRTKITKATNYQSTVDDLSLHATDQLHFDIEDRFKLYGLYYDRRKGEYRNLRKPISQIISILTLARAVIAILVGEPDNARGSPQRVLRKEYTSVFNDSYNRDVYVTCILLDRAVEEYLESKEVSIPADARRDIRYFVDRYVICALAATDQIDQSRVASLAPICVKPINQKVLAEATQEMWALYSQLGATDKLAKSQLMRNKLLELLHEKFGNTKEN